MGSNSFLSKLVTYDPINHLTGGKFNKVMSTATKFIDPVGGTLLGKLGGYSTSSGPGAPGPYGGVTPTLADSARGYVAASQGKPVSSPQVAASGASNPTAAVNTLFGPTPQGQQNTLVQQQQQRMKQNPNPTIGATQGANLYG